MAHLDEALPRGPDWVGRDLADIKRDIRELRAGRSIEATIGYTTVDLTDLEDAVGPLPAPGQVARRDEPNTFAAAQRFDVSLLLGPSGNVLVAFGTGSPEGVVTAAVGSHYHRSDGGSSTSLYVKESGAGNTGWVAYGAGGGGGSSDHALLTNVTANQHHNQAHAIDGADHTGTLTHAALGSVTANQHHNQAHTDSDHSDGANVKAALVDAKGDLIAATAADTVARLAVGANDFVLTADSTTGTGLKWAAGAAHPNLATHDALGLATDAELTTHAGAADPHTGYVLESLYDAKGDLLAASAADTPARLAVGANATVLTADSAEATGLKWATAGAGSATDVQVFTSSGTWTKPAGAMAVEVVAVGSGGGGGAGRRGAAGSVRSGGGGGGGGGATTKVFPASVLGATETVTVGTAAGGAATTADNTNGFDGATGSASTFGASNPFWVRAGAGGGGGGGSGSAGNGGAAGTGASSGAAGAGSSGTGGAGSNGAATSSGGGSGASAGGITTGNAASSGGAGGARPLEIGSGGGGSAGTAGGAGGNGTDAPASSGNPGPGGGGGASSTSAAAGAGGNGGVYGAGGGGGGASLNGNNSGAGGAGGGGIVIVISYP